MCLSLGISTFMFRSVSGYGCVEGGCRCELLILILTQTMSHAIRDWTDGRQGRRTSTYAMGQTLILTLRLSLTTIVTYHAGGIS